LAFRKGIRRKTRRFNPTAEAVKMQNKIITQKNEKSKTSVETLGLSACPEKLVEAGSANLFPSGLMGDGDNFDNFDKFGVEFKESMASLVRLYGARDDEVTFLGYYGSWLRESCDRRALEASAVYLEINVRRLLTILGLDERIVDVWNYNDNKATAQVGLSAPLSVEQDAQVEKVTISSWGKQSSSSRRKEWFSRWRKMSPSYLDYMHFHGVFSLQAPPWLSPPLIDKLRESGKFWFLEAKDLGDESGDEGAGGDGGNIYRMRLRGCGDRDLAPIEGTYYCDTMANDAFGVVRGMADALREVDLECLGEKWIFTIPKDLSVRLDGCRGTAEWRKLVGKLFHGAKQLIQRLHSEGEIGLVSSLHLSGEECPWTAHYHLNFYVSPHVRVGDAWAALRRWVEASELDNLRERWRKKVERIFGVGVNQVDIHRGYFSAGRWGEVYHFIRYLFRHPLEDLWKGWGGYTGGRETDGKVTYTYSKKYKRVTLVEEGGKVLEAFSRFMELPKSFKRIRWYGYLVGAKRGEVLASLGFVRMKVGEAKKDSDVGGGWSRCGVYELMSCQASGWVFRAVGGIAREIVVPVEALCFCPSDTLKGMKVWVAPSRSP
jgi:hypothetical protein